MSYEPHLLISYKDLQKKADRINAGYYDRQGESDQEIDAWKYLQDALRDKPLEFRKEKLIIVHPELTLFNQAVRELLEDLGIYYITWY